MRPFSKLTALVLCGVPVLFGSWILFSSVYTVPQHASAQEPRKEDCAGKKKSHGLEICAHF